MDIKVKVIGTERTDDGKNRVVLRANNETFSLLLTDAEITNVNTARNAIEKQLKHKSIVGQEFSITV